MTKQVTRKWDYVKEAVQRFTRVGDMLIEYEADPHAVIHAALEAGLTLRDLERMTGIKYATLHRNKHHRSEMPVHGSKLAGRIIAGICEHDRSVAREVLERIGARVYKEIPINWC